MPKPNKISWARKDGSLGVGWQVRYVDRTGKRRSKVLEKKADAARFADTITSEVLAGKHVHDRDTVKVSEAAQRWLSACERGRNGRDAVEPHTIRNYEQFVRLHINPALGELRLNELTPARIREFRDVDMIDGGRSRWMTKKCLGALSAICSEAVADELLSVNPCVGIRLVSSKRQNDEVTIPTKDEIRELMSRAAAWIEAAPKVAVVRRGRTHMIPKRLSRHRALWFFTMLRFIITTGCRLSEVRGALWDALHVDGHYSVRQRADERGRIGPPKSASGWRELDLDAGLLADLERWRRVAPKSDLIFANGKGKPEPASNIYKRFWLPLLLEAGIAKRIVGENGSARHEAPFSVHDLRHFHASLMIEAGMEPKALQEHMGHSSIKVTMDVYGHLFKDEQAKARRRAIVTGAVSGLLGHPAEPVEQ